MPLPTKANVSRPEAWGYDALIEFGPTDADSLYLRVAAGPGRQARFDTVDPQQKGPSTSATPEDMRPESGEIFSRSNFSGGEGLDRAHRRDSTERDWTRFWDSRNIDITPARAGQAEEIKLLHSTSLLRAVDVAGIQRSALVRLGGALYGVISDDTQVDRTADPTATTPTWTVEDPHAGQPVEPIRDLASLGDELYAAFDTSGIHKRDAAGTWTHWSDQDAHRIWGVKGRILSAKGTTLYEAGATTTSTLLHTLASGETWNDVVDAGGAILAAASDGYIYAFVETDGVLSLKGQTRTEGEVPTALGYAQGLVFIGTSEDTTAGGKIGRLWRALLIGLRLREAQVLRQWGDGTETRDRSPKRIISTREAIWTALIEDGTETHLWRYHLETGGLVRDLILGASSVAEGLAVFDDRLFVNLTSSGLYREDTTYASSGYLIGPLADFYNAAPKAWMGARLQTGSVPSGAQVVLAYSTDPAAIEDSTHSSWTNIITATNASPGDSTETPISDVQSRYLAGKLTLTPDGTNANTPSALAYAFRGLPLPTED
ncbi:MAG: hypothetical protein ACE5F5_13645, partial [Acidimicrobiia bacterium]